MKNQNPCLKLVAAAALTLGLGATAHAAGLSHQDSSFLKDAAQAGSAEVAGSRLALQQAVGADTRTFAQEMIDDQSRTDDELRVLAGQKGVRIADEPSTTKKAELKLLAARKGASFDQHYAESIGVKEHQDTIGLFQKEIDKGTDPDVKAWARKTLPVLTHQLEEAENLKTRTLAMK